MYVEFEHMGSMRLGELHEPRIVVALHDTMCMFRSDPIGETEP
ncbi:hypothetical protein GL4_2485 [Methyloceanibacter caenitepidi]|uniref:Uncharacterized protein n=1 Tax=Methyloceanibacter caenitepidi TaxID=1384459 RepID=A0A0A8K7G1_9HYPH|nr:hypothetical protein GL4_2485 [Methyloceanibacter caenitepidi]